MGVRRNVAIAVSTPLGNSAPIHPASEYLWRKVYRVDSWRGSGGRCCYCREPVARHEITADHCVSRKAGGTTSRENIKAACMSCNSAKGHMTEQRFKTLLRSDANDVAVSVLLARFRFRLWSRVQIAEKRIMRLAGLDTDG